ncbi:MAG TPA: methyl-accepting chemotaxis protein, partial [Rheinheimera sp.]|uniref:methyl-accepting chemotaxis protein n=1 Tax=Rheinheimera sp. TaxID=1869214 RepID=UPI002F95F656
LIPATLLQNLADRSELRNAVDSLALTGVESGSRYTAVITSLIAVMHQIEEGIVDLDAIRSMTVLNHFMQMKERAGRERAIVGAALGQNNADAALLHRYSSNAGEFDAYLSMFRLVATEQQISAYERRMQDPIVAEVAKMKAQLLATPQGQAIGLSSETWFTKATGRINKMAEVERELVATVALLAQDKYQQAYRALLLSVGIVLVCLLLVVLVTYLIVSNIKLAVTCVTDTLQQLAVRNLTASALYQGRDEFGAITAALNHMSHELKQVMAEIGSAASQVATAAEQASAVTLQTSKGIQQQLQDTEQVVTAMHEMSTTVRDVASNTAEAAEMSGQANHSAEQGKKEVSATLLLIRELSEHTTRTAQTVDLVKTESRDITGVLDVIRGIAEQTNLLALNAAIEAARAGDQGRGFAVVAAEVRVLAQRTQEATVDIQSMIERLQVGADNAQQAMQVSLQQAKDSVERVAQVGERLEEVNRDINAINDMNTQIASAAEEQNSVVEDINRNLTSINDIAVQTSAGAEQTAMTSQELARLAELLQDQVQSFKM